MGEVPPTAMVTMATLSCVNLATFVMCIIMAVFATQVKRMTTTDVQPVTQIAADWQATPFIDI